MSFGLISRLPPSRSLSFLQGCEESLSQGHSEAVFCGLVTKGRWTGQMFQYVGVGKLWVRLLWSSRNHSQALVLSTVIHPDQLLLMSPAEHGELSKLGLLLSCPAHR